MDKKLHETTNLCVEIMRSKRQLKLKYWTQRCSPCTPMTYQVLLPLALSLCTRMTPPVIAKGRLLITLAPCKGIHDSLGYLDSTLWIPDSEYWIPGSSSVDSGFQKGWIPIFFFCCYAFLRISFSCSNLAILKRRCLECITSLFSFSIYKLREEMFYCSVRV